MRVRTVRDTLGGGTRLISQLLLTTSNGTPTPAHASAGAALATHWRPVRSHDDEEAIGDIGLALAKSAERLLARRALDRANLGLAELTHSWLA